MFCSVAMSGSGGPSLADAHVAEACAGSDHSIWYHVCFRASGSAYCSAGRGELPHTPARSQPQKTGAARADCLRPYGYFFLG